MEKTMTSYLGRMGDPDARGPDPTEAPRQDGQQHTDGADRAELRRALLVYGVAGALGAEYARGVSEPRG
jgi:hypothetical protein